MLISHISVLSYKRQEILTIGEHMGSALDSWLGPCCSYFCFLCGVCFRPMFSVWCLFPSYVLCVQCSLCLWSVYSSLHLLLSLTFISVFCVVFVSVLCFLCGVCFRPMFPVWCLFPSYVLCVQCSLCLWSVYSSPSVISNVYLSEWYILRFYIMLQFVFLKIGMYLYDFLCRQIWYLTDFI